jgi:hypothetical protein
MGLFITLSVVIIVILGGLLVVSLCKVNDIEDEGNDV